MTAATKQKGAEREAAKPKLAVIVADAIEERIAQEGWRVGEIVGSEAELLVQYGVSRAVLREAMLLLQARQVAVPRRGPGGGLMVSVPQASSVSDAAARLLEYEGMTGAHLHEARLSIEQMAVELATRNLDEAGIARLRALAAPKVEKSRAEKLDQLRTFHGLLAELSGNPVLKLVVAVLVLVAQDFLNSTGEEVPDPEIEQSLERQRAIIEAVCDGDAALARARVKDYLEWVRRYAGDQNR